MYLFFYSPHNRTTLYAFRDIKLLVYHPQPHPQHPAFGGRQNACGGRAVRTWFFCHVCDKNSPFSALLVGDSVTLKQFCLVILYVFACGVWVLIKPKHVEKDSRRRRINFKLISADYTWIFVRILKFFGKNYAPWFFKQVLFKTKNRCTDKIFFYVALLEMYTAQN